MRRRQFLIVAGVAAAAPLVRAQAPKAAAKLARVGILGMTPRGGSPALEQPFVDAMHALGWIENRNILYDRAYADEEAQLPTLAAELVARTPDVIFTIVNPATTAAFGKTRTLPIVSGALSDPVELGVIQSLAHPGRNVTGMGNIGWELGGKRLQTLKELLPKIGRVGILVHSLYANSLREQKLIEESARGLGVKAFAVVVKQYSELDTAFASLGKNRVEAVLTTHIAPFLIDRKHIIQLATNLRIPVVGHRSEMADEGALLSYSSILTDQLRRSAVLVDKVLKGAKPGDLPVEQPTRFELVINLKTAKSLGIRIPQAMLVRADRVIE